MASESTFLSKCEKLAMFIASPHNSSSVMEQFLAAPGDLLLAYAISFGFLLCNPNFTLSRIIGVSIWALYISSTHLHLYQRW